MKIKSMFLFLTIMIFRLSNGQNNVSLHLVDKDFGIWAYKQHNEICKIVHDHINSGQLGSYNAKNLKESIKESMGKLAVKKTVFIQTDMRDPSIGKDSVIMDVASDNYYFFKTSGEYILLKPFRENNNLLKLNKAELFALLNKEQTGYFTSFTSNFMLCIDSIPIVSRRLFNDFNSKLFEFSKLPSTTLFMNDSLKRTWSAQEKESLSQDQSVVFIATDPDDPDIGKDTIILFEYDIHDTSKQLAIMLMCEFRDFHVKVHTISCGLERKLMGYMKILQPFGYLPYDERLPYSAKELEMLNAVIQLRMEDGLNTDRNNEDMYDDYFGENY